MEYRPQYERLHVREADNILAINDLHENTSMLEKALAQATANGKKTLLVLSDILLHDERPRAYHDLGLKEPQQIMTEYVMNRLGERERETFQIGQALDHYGGLEQYIQAVKQQQPTVNADALRQQLGMQYSRYRSDLFQKTLENVVHNSSAAEKAKLEEDQLRAIAGLQLANRYMDDEGLDSIAAVLKKYRSGIAAVIIGAGNHDNIMHAQGLEKRLGQRVYWSEHLEGEITAGDLTFQVVTNTGSLIPTSEAIVYGSAVTELYSHLTHAGHVTDEKILRNPPQHLLDSSPTYQRLKNVKSLDMLISHFDPFQNEQGLVPLPKDVGAYWVMNKLKAGAPVLSGHIHSAKEGVNLVGRRAVRQPGATLITKSAGSVHMQTVAQYSKVEANYSIATYRKRLDEEIEAALAHIKREFSKRRAA